MKDKILAPAVNEDFFFSFNVAVTLSREGVCVTWAGTRVLCDVLCVRLKLAPEELWGKYVVAPT